MTQATPLILATLFALTTPVFAQNPANDDDWFPWMYSVDTNDESLLSGIDSDQALKQLKSIDLWSKSGQTLVTRLVLHEQFDNALQKFSQYAATQEGNAEVQSTYGMLLTYAAYMGESETEIEERGTRAYEAFSKAAKIVPTNWDAWFGQAVLFAYSEETQLEHTAVRILTEATAAQEQDVRRPRYAYGYLVLGDVHQSLGQHGKAKAAWKRGLELYPDNPSLQMKAKSTTD